MLYGIPVLSGKSFVNHPIVRQAVGSPATQIAGSLIAQSVLSAIIGIALQQYHLQQKLNDEV